MSWSYSVRIWAIRENRSSKRRTYELRWKVGAVAHSRTFVKKGLADGFRSELKQASTAGERFDTDTGLPESKLRELASVSCYELAREYVRMKWPKLAAKSRSSIVDALATVIPALVSNSNKTRAVSADLRRALIGYGFNPLAGVESDWPVDVRSALRVLERQSITVAELANPDTARRALDALAQKMDGTPASATTIARKRAVFHNFVKYLIRERRVLDSDPIDMVEWSAPNVAEVVDRRVVANHAQVRALLTAVSYAGRTRGPRLVAFFACLYYGGLRPSEALALRRGDCHLPGAGWGTLTLERTEPEAGRRYTDDGSARDRRGLKHRAAREVRSVPIPPNLVRILRDHMAAFGTAPDGRLFVTRTGGTFTSSAYWRVWQIARSLAFTPEQRRSPLAGRPYDLRHAAVTLWLNGGVPPQVVASRVGHSVDVLWKVYAGCVDGDDERLNRLIERALAA